MSGLLSRWCGAVLVLAGLGTSTAGAVPADVLQVQAPSLFRLYQEYAGYQPALREYANRQGFRAPFENLATVVHEMIHIASAVHAGFFIDGVYYEPYVVKSAWPALTNSDIMGSLLPEERGVISAFYLPSTPRNTMGNILDEINAYSHVAGFVCLNEPGSGVKQVHNLAGHMLLLEAYLRQARTRLPADYIKLAASRVSRGAIETLYFRAVAALKACGAVDPQIPGRETKHFLEFARARTKG